MNHVEDLIFRLSRCTSPKDTMEALAHWCYGRAELCNHQAMYTAKLIPTEPILDPTTTRLEVVRHTDRAAHWVLLSDIFRQVSKGLPVLFIATLAGCEKVAEIILRLP